MVLLYPKLTFLLTFSCTHHPHFPTSFPQRALLDIDRAVDDGHVVLALAAVLQHVREAALSLLWDHYEAERKKYVQKSEHLDYQENSRNPS